MKFVPTLQRRVESRRAGVLQWSYQKLPKLFGRGSIPIAAPDSKNLRPTSFSIFFPIGVFLALKTLVGRAAKGFPYISLIAAELCPSADDARQDPNQLIPICGGRDMAQCIGDRWVSVSCCSAEAWPLASCRDQRRTFNEPFEGFTFTKFDGQRTVYPVSSQNVSGVNASAQCFLKCSCSSFLGAQRAFS